MHGSVAAREALVSSLRRKVEKLEGGRQPEDERAVSTGVRALDRLLPGGGLKRGTLVEYLSPSSGSGAATLSLAAAREACGEGRALVVVERGNGGEVRGQRSEVRDESPKFKVQSSKLGDRRQETGDRGQEPIGRFYPPAAAAWGIDLAAMLVLRTTNEADALWAFDQALRCPGVGAVWGAWERLDVRDFRRLQLAAETGGAIGLLVRPAWLWGQPTWAEVRLLISPKSEVQSPKWWRWQSGARLKRKFNELEAWFVLVELVRCRGAAGGQKVMLELDEMNGEWREVDYEPAHSVSVFTELADSAARGA